MLQPLRERFPAQNYPQLLVGLERADDAAVYQLNERQAIVSTTDFFPPIVDDPYDFGAIAAANALSDIYAMGGRPLFAINLVAFPDDVDRDILRLILKGGADKVHEAGAVIAGGHSVSDPEPKYGLAVTGIVDPAHVKRKAGAQPGDLLLLTKPLGVGVLTTALKQEKATAEDIAEAVASMQRLNKTAAEQALAHDAHAMTDITGFGLLGHAREMAAQSPVDFHFDSTRLPWLPNAQAYAEQGALPGGMRRNRDYFAPFVTFGDRVGPTLQRLLWTPETSGGLLIAIKAQEAAAFQADLPDSTVIGSVRAGQGHIIVN